jgi:protein phosphatase PTC2/3
MDRCLAPDSDINGGLGCDNMTIAIVGILGGRTKDEWYDWIAERVEKQYGYETPVALPELYAPTRVAAARERWSNPSPRGGGGGTFTRGGAAGGLGALARVFGSNITFHPSGGISNNGAHNLMFDQEESSDEYESGDEGMEI